jgi:hypothetical protein
MPQARRLRAAGMIAAAAGLLGGAGDILLFYTPGFAADMFAVRVLPDWRILSGVLLAILVIPLLSLGYWAFSRYLRGAGEAFADVIFVGGIYGAGIGSAIHGTVGTLVQVVQRGGITAQDADFIASYARFVVPLYGLFYVLMAAGTIALAVVIWQRKTAFPRWFVLLLPLWSNVLILPLGRLIPPLGDLLVPSIANLSHALLFGATTVLFWGREADLSGPPSKAG